MTLERREWKRVNRAGAERDASGRRTQRIVWFDCPFCGVEVKGYVWSLNGGGKRCACGALHFHGSSEAALPRFRVEETPGSRRGRREVEAFAPDGFKFDGEVHSLVERSRALWRARDLVLARARASALVSCEDDCDCKEGP